MEQSNGGPSPAAHSLASLLAAAFPSPHDNEDEFDKQAQPTSDDGDAGNAEKSQEDDLVISQDGEQSENGAEGESDDDDEFDDDEEHYLDFLDDSEDEDRSENDPDFNFKWLEKIDVEASCTAHLDEHGEPKRVAFCEAKLIRRDQMRDDFHDQMEQPSRETSLLAFDLFDRYGRLRPEFKTHSVIKGNGVWGQELDHGDILLIEQVFVDKDYRRQGLGRRMIESLLTLVQEKTWSFFVFVWPTILRLSDIQRELDSLPDDVERDKMEDREHDRATTFCRSLGFRRVGSSIWFALAPGNDHPSHQLTSIEDFNPPEAPLSSLHLLLTPFQQICDSPRSHFDQVLSPQPREDPDFLEVLQNCLLQKGSADACWTSQDKDGNTILHLTASMFNVACVEWVLKQDFGARLLEMRNNRGETPSELVQFKLEKLRTQKVINHVTIPVSDRFEGHSGSAIHCSILLKALGSMESFIELEGQNALRRMARGCTCGQCLKGFLSPRMSHALLYQAHIGYDMLDGGLGMWSGPDWVEVEEDHLGYLPSRVRNNLKTNKSMRQGFVNLWLHVATCLENGRVPTAPNVIGSCQRWWRVASCY